MKKLLYSIMFFCLTTNLYPQSNSNKSSGFVTDIDGNKYKTVNIGSQVWMADNLRVTRFNNGHEIQLVSDNLTWYNLNQPAYCWYNNSKSEKNRLYGALYNWHAVATGNLCPAGWHVPSDKEWKIVIDFLQSSISADSSNDAYLSSNSEAKARATGSFVSFPFIPGGVRIGNGSFSLECFNYWWSSDESGSSRASITYIYDDEGNMSGDRYEKNYGFSVRCLKDSK
ncbi:MAG TPA: fibrobacter succinogenes major paralogous domain-containing protein [Bacteroidales bacterium]|nr:hypothetical protein [Bacteroidales bacterium]HRC90223.1 fibrobacter succinogenes major paralogous domain-containing protein [Bacteroidales bacterium]